MFHGDGASQRALARTSGRKARPEKRSVAIKLPSHNQSAPIFDRRALWYSISIHVCCRFSGKLPFTGKDITNYWLRLGDTMRTGRPL